MQDLLVWKKKQLMIEVYRKKNYVEYEEQTIIFYFIKYGNEGTPPGNNGDSRFKLSQNTFPCSI